MEDLDKRLDAATKRRDAIAAEVRRLEGRLEAATASLSAVEAECRSKGIDPTKIDAYITQLTQKYESIVRNLEVEVESASTTLAPYLKETVSP